MSVPGQGGAVDGHELAPAAAHGVDGARELLLAHARLAHDQQVVVPLGQVPEDQRLAGQQRRGGGHRREGALPGRARSPPGPISAANRNTAACVPKQMIAPGLSGHRLAAHRSALEQGAVAAAQVADVRPAAARVRLDEGVLARHPVVVDRPGLLGRGVGRAADLQRALHADHRAAGAQAGGVPDDDQNRDRLCGKLAGVAVGPGILVAVTATGHREPGGCNLSILDLGSQARP